MVRSMWLLLTALVLGLAFSPAFAGSATWLANPVSGDWNTAGNWTAGGPPNSMADMATFDSSAVSNLWLSATSLVDGVTFNSSAGTAYTIRASALEMFGPGIINNSGITQNFVAGGIDFGNNASAGVNTAFTMGGDASDGGRTYFFGSSTAGNATFTVNGSNHSNGWGGGVSFYDTSSAGNATITVNGSAFQHCPIPYYSFANPYSAGPLSLDPCFDNPYPAATLFFEGSSTAGNATLVANGGVGEGDGAGIEFAFRSTGETARVEVFGNGHLDISNHDLAFPEVTIGSLAGDGVVFLGRFTLTIGGNNLSTNFSGALHDGNSFGAGSAIGSLTKVGTGTLTLSGTNTYTGLTTVNAGKLRVSGSVASAVSVNNGGTLGGSGTTRSVTVNSGGIVAPGGSQTLQVNGNYVQGNGGALAITIGGNTAGTEYDQLIVSGVAQLGGTLNLSLSNGFRPAVGDVFQFLVAGAISGNFDTLNTTGFTGQVNYGPGSITVTVTSVPDIPLNISTRLRVQTGDNVLIGGFIVTGTEAKRVILRALGPSLTGLGVPGALADPTLELHAGNGATIATNDDWKETQQAEIEATGIAPTNDLESAIVRTLDPGAYTAIVRGKNNATGVGLVEAYDLAQAAKSQLGNMSTRGFVNAGDNVMIGGFIIGGHGGADGKVIVRALGPSLTALGVPMALEDPTLELHNGNGATSGFKRRLARSPTGGDRSHRTRAD